jgi:hypothetical protein
MTITKIKLIFYIYIMMGMDNNMIPIKINEDELKVGRQHQCDIIEMTLRVGCRRRKMKHRKKGIEKSCKECNMA